MLARDSSKDKNEGAMNKAKGRSRRPAASLTGNEGRKAEGRTDQDKGTLKE